MASEEPASAWAPPLHFGDTSELWSGGGRTAATKALCTESGTEALATADRRASTVGQSLPPEPQHPADNLLSPAFLLPAQTLGNPHRPTRGHAHRPSGLCQVEAVSASTHCWGTDKGTRRPHSEAMNQRHTDYSTESKGQGHKSITFQGRLEGGSPGGRGRLTTKGSRDLKRMTRHSYTRGQNHHQKAPSSRHAARWSVSQQPPWQGRGEHAGWPRLCRHSGPATASASSSSSTHDLLT